MRKTAKTTYAWCFAHGQLHTFPADTEPWCTAHWVPFAVNSEAAALEAKAFAFGDAVFFDDLPTDLKLEVLEIANAWH